MAVGHSRAVWDLLLLPPLYKVLFVTVCIKVPLMDINALAFLWVSITLVFSCFSSSAVMAFKGMATVSALKVSKAQPATSVQTQTSTARTVTKVSNSDGDTKGKFRTKTMVQTPVYWIPFWQDQHHERSDKNVIISVPSNNSGENMLDITVVMFWKHQFRSLLLRN